MIQFASKSVRFDFTNCNTTLALLQGFEAPLQRLLLLCQSAHQPPDYRTFLTVFTLHLGAKAIPLLLCRYQRLFPARFNLFISVFSLLLCLLLLRFQPPLRGLNAEPTQNPEPTH